MHKLKIILLVLSVLLMSSYTFPEKGNMPIAFLHVRFIPWDVQSKDNRSRSEVSSPFDIVQYNGFLKIHSYYDQTMNIEIVDSSRDTLIENDCIDCTEDVIIPTDDLCVGKYTLYIYTEDGVSYASFNI